MTTSPDFDRLARAWLDLMPDEVPDRVIDTVLQAIDATPQRRARLRVAVWRDRHMNRLSLAAVAAAIVVVIAGGTLAFTAFRSPGIGGPLPAVGPTPSRATLAGQTALPSETPLITGLGRGMGMRGQAPEDLRSTSWVAAGGSLGRTYPLHRLNISADGHEVVFDDPSGRDGRITSEVVSGGPEDIDLVSMNADSACASRDVGRYRPVLTSDGESLTLTLISDTCRSRSGVLNRAWTRAIDGSSHGGRGVIAEFEPSALVTVTLPTTPDGSRFEANAGNESASITSVSLDRTFLMVKNPTGWSAPCAPNGGSSVKLAPGSAAFVAYLQTLPGFTVNSARMKIDGRPGLHLTIPTTQTPECQKADRGIEAGRVSEWGASNQDSSRWFITQGDTDVIYLVDFGNDLYLIQWLGSGVTPEEEQQVISTVHFVHSLPSTP
jgi:hypothetical protein